MISPHMHHQIPPCTYSVPLKTPKTKLGIPPKDAEVDKFDWLSKILLGKPMDPILKLLEKAEREFRKYILLPHISGLFQRKAYRNRAMPWRELHAEVLAG